MDTKTGKNLKRGAVLRLTRTVTGCPLKVGDVVIFDKLTTLTSDYDFRTQNGYSFNFDEVESALNVVEASPEAALTGGSSSYYIVEVKHPTSEGVKPYRAECNDLIEVLGLNFAEGNIFKALWRIGQFRKGLGKKGTTAKYDSEKVKFFGDRVEIQNN